MGIKPTVRFLFGSVSFYPRDAVLARVAMNLISLSVCPSVQPSVRHKPVLYRNDWMNRAGFWHGSFLLPILPCVVRKFGYLQK